MAHYQLFIDGELCDAAEGETFASYNPATGEKIADIAKASKQDAVRAIEAARKAFDEGPWPKMSGKERAAKLREIAAKIGENAAELAELESLDGGGTIRKSQLADVPGAQASFEWFARMAEERPDTVELEGSPFPISQNQVRYEPIGVTTGIVPWNFPLIMASWKIAPAIAAGNTSVLKPATYTSITALKMAEIIAECDLPPGVVNVIAGPGGTVGEELAANPMVDKTAFTGSTEVGRRIMQLASGTVKGCTLELGGKSANIVLDDADLDAVVRRDVTRMCTNSGQSCNAPSRMLVPRDLLARAAEVAADAAGSIRVGVPADEATTVGPVVSQTQYDRIQALIEKGIGEGATLVAGGPGRPDGLDVGYYVRPTVFTDVTNDMTIAQEEIFGPVLVMIGYDDDDDAVRIANDTRYGLSGYVSGSQDRARDIARRIRTGNVHVNGAGPDFDAPFGGYKQSGNGREWGRLGFEEFLETKAIMGWTGR